MGISVLETTLLERARGGDGAAFEQLLRPLIVPACRLAFSLLHDWEESEDVVQEASLKAWRAVTRLAPDSPSLRPWFLSIVTNQARSVRRRHSFIRTITQPDLGAWLSRREPVADRRDELIDLRRLVASLDEDLRTLLFLRYGLDLPLDEVAATMRLTPAAAKSRLYRALRAMRPALESAEE